MRNQKHHQRNNPNYGNGIREQQELKKKQTTGNSIQTERGKEQGEEKENNESKKTEKDVTDTENVTEPRKAQANKQIWKR